MRLTRKITSYAGYAMLLVAAYAGSLFFTSDDVVSVGLEFKDPAATTLELVTDCLKMISSLSLAVIGAASALVVKGRDWSGRWSSIETALTMIAFVLAAMSTYFVYVSYMALLSTAQNGALALTEGRLQGAMSAGYYCLLSAVTVVGAVFVGMAAERRVDPPK